MKKFNQPLESEKMKDREITLPSALFDSSAFKFFDASAKIDIFIV